MTRNIKEYRGQAWDVHDEASWTYLMQHLLPQHPDAGIPQDARFIIRSGNGTPPHPRNRFIALSRQPGGNNEWRNFKVLKGYEQPARSYPHFPVSCHNGHYAIATRVSRKHLPQKSAGSVTGRVPFKHPQFDWSILTDLSALERYCLSDVLNSRPPLGLKPRKLHDQHRQDQIEEAIERYMRDDKPIPLEWVEEYNELVKRYAAVS